MTHEELLSIMNNYTFKDSAEPVKALRAVVELHKPFNSPISEPICSFCLKSNSIISPYPCPTIQAIEKELS